MKQMLKPTLENKARLEKARFSSEIDTVQAIREARTRARQSNWTPGTSSMTDADHLKVIDQLRSETNLSQIAVSTTEK